MENNILKEKVRRNVKEKIAITNIRKELCMKSKNTKLIYSLISVCAVFLIVLGVCVGKNTLDNRLIANNYYATENSDKENIAIDLKINKVENMAVRKLDVEMKNFDIANLPEKFEFVKSINMPPEYKLKEVYNIFTKEDVNVKEYNLLHDYVFCYEKDSENMIKIAFSEIEKPIRDYFINTQNEISKIGDVEVIISQFEKKYLVTLNVDGLYIDIEANGITESQLIDILNSIIL